jgi:uncharacterized protein YecE (DUF72 family)
MEKNVSTMSSGSIHLGTSGWTYDHWKEVFYPNDVPKRQWFEYYCSQFQTVELNASFYRIPTLKVVEGWNSRSPQEFRFAIKMSRLVTHERKLKNCEHELEWFFSVFEPLTKKIAVFLIQLPPTLKFDPDRIINFSRLFPRDAHAVFEFRNTTWYRDETVSVLRDLGYSFCIHDMSELATEKIVTSPIAYIRFHGFDSQYGGDYPDNHLLQWAKWIKAQAARGVSVYGYFNNDIGGFAVKNCRKLIQLVDGVTP